MKKKVNAKLESLKVSSFRTDTHSSRIKGGTMATFNDPLACTAFCGTGETCPECAYTQYFTCEGGEGPVL